jgi:REP element-mobilizing transposase RayT
MPWPHAPTHHLAAGGTYFVTASTYHKAHYFRGADRLGVLHRGLLTLARDYGWLFEAWAVFSNHYHFVAQSPPDAPDACNLSEMLSVLHVKTAKWVNKLDRAKAGARSKRHELREASWSAPTLRRFGASKRRRQAAAFRSRASSRGPHARNCSRVPTLDREICGNRLARHRARSQTYPLHVPR